MCLCVCLTYQNEVVLRFGQQKHGQSNTFFSRLTPLQFSAYQTSAFFLLHVKAKNIIYRESRISYYILSGLGLMIITLFCLFFMLYFVLCYQFYRLEAYTIFQSLFPIFYGLVSMLQVSLLLLDYRFSLIVVFLAHSQCTDWLKIQIMWVIVFYSVQKKIYDTCSQNWDLRLSMTIYSALIRAVTHSFCNVIHLVSASVCECIWD